MLSSQGQFPEYLVQEIVFQGLKATQEKLLGETELTRKTLKNTFIVIKIK